MKLAIYGYGNLGKGVELAATAASDITVMGVFTRRNPDSVKTLTGIPVFPADDILNYKNDIDVLVVCGGSATDLPVMMPSLAESFNVVDSFDTHAKIPEHFNNVNASAEKSSHTALISGGWDPGMFSVMRLYAESILPTGSSYTFWGKGVSQGHSDACRRIKGVKDARQYTIPVESALEDARSGREPVLTATSSHRRECFIVAEDGADKAWIENEIKSMPAYFEGYDTTVHFITEEEMKKNHSELPHGGKVIRTGKTGLDDNHSHTVEFSLTLDSNPEFTGSVLVSLARAVNKLSTRGIYGCKTIFDIAPADLSPLSPEDLRAHML